MNTLEHTMAPEDVMAFVDGELSAADARVVREHLEHCAECTLLVEQLRRTSEMLERWEVPAVPRAVEEVVIGKADGISAQPKWVSAVVPHRGKWFAIGGVGVGVVCLILVSVQHRGSSPASFDRIDQYAQLQSAPQSAPAMPPEALASREYAPTRDQLLALEKRKQQAAMRESLVANGAMSANLPPMGGVAGMTGAMSGAMAQKDARNLRAPMIARTASLTIVVKNVESARTAVDAIVARYQGYPAMLTANTPESGARSVFGSLKVPAERMNAAIGELRALGRVVNEAQSGDDIGQQHEDLVARLKTSRETEERFQAILQQRTGKISDVLQVEENIARVRGDIESMEAEQRAMEHRVDFATVEVQLTEVYKAKLEAPDSVGTRLHNAFVAGYHHAAESVLGFVLFLEEFGPALLIWGLVLAFPVVLILRRYKKARGRVGF